jgi:hypothetical protein
MKRARQASKRKSSSTSKGKATKAAKARSGRAKAKASPKRAKKLAKPKTKLANKKKSKGLSIVELFQLKNKHAHDVHPAGADWKHKKDLPPQDQPSKEDMRVKNNAAGKKSGFGGARHH